MKAMLKYAFGALLCVVNTEDVTSRLLKNYS